MRANVERQRRGGGHSRGPFFSGSQQTRHFERFARSRGAADGDVLGDRASTAYTGSNADEQQ